MTFAFAWPVVVVVILALVGALHELAKKAAECLAPEEEDDQ